MDVSERFSCCQHLLSCPSAFESLPFRGTTTCYPPTPALSSTSCSPLPPSPSSHPLQQYVALEAGGRAAPVAGEGSEGQLAAGRQAGEGQGEGEGEASGVLRGFTSVHVVSPSSSSSPSSPPSSPPPPLLLCTTPDCRLLLYRAQGEGEVGIAVGAHQPEAVSAAGHGVRGGGEAAKKRGRGEGKGGEGEESASGGRGAGGWLRLCQQLVGNNGEVVDVKFVGGDRLAMATNSEQVRGGHERGEHEGDGRLHDATRSGEWVPVCCIVYTIHCIGCATCHDVISL